MYVCAYCSRRLSVWRALRLTVCGHECVSYFVYRMSRDERAATAPQTNHGLANAGSRRPRSPRFRIDTRFSSNASQYQLGKKRIEMLSRYARAKAPSLVAPSLETRVKYRSTLTVGRVDPEIASIHYTARSVATRTGFRRSIRRSILGYLDAAARGCWSCLFLGEESRRVSSPTCVCFVAVWGCTGFV